VKKSVNKWVLPGGMGLKEGFALLKKTGFEGMEINFAKEGADVNLKTTKPEAEQIVSLANEAGIKVCSVCAGWPPLTSNSAEERKEAIEYAMKAIEVTSWVGADTVLIVPGTVKEDVSYDVVYERAKKAMLEIAPVAEKYKVFVGVENVWNKFLLSPLEMKNFIEEINQPYVQVYFDVGNFVPWSYPEQWIRILGKKIKKIHLKDFRTSVGNAGGFVNLLEGDVNWPEVLKALKEIGYDDYLTAEFGPYKYYPETMLIHLSVAMDKILGK